MTYRVVVLAYGEQIGNGGAFDHPDGETCALMVRDIIEVHEEDRAIQIGIEMEEDRMVHSVIIEEIE